MLNDIIIDKLRIALRVNENILEALGEEKDLSKFKKRLEKTLRQYFPKEGFKVYKRYNYFFIEFNPTRFNGIFAKRYEDNNLQMIPEEAFLGLLERLNFEEFAPLSCFNIVELNLTKNFLLQHKASDYIKMLANTTPKRLHPILFKGGNSQSVYFSTLKRDNEDKEYTGAKLIKFYDKTAELKHKKNNHVSSIQLRERLSGEEIKCLGSRYKKINNTVDLDKSNILRVELTYKNSRNLKKIVEFVDKNKLKNLSLNFLFSHLEDNTLYSTLDDFFKAELKDKIFYNDINAPIIVKGKPNSYNAVLSSLLLGENLKNIESEMYYIKNVLDVAGMGNEISGKLREINKGIINQELYADLHRAIFNNINNVKPELDWGLYPFDAEEFDLDLEQEQEIICERSASIEDFDVSELFDLDEFEN